MAEGAAPPARKVILALDGGGVRGVVSLAFLQRLEKLLAELLVLPPGRQLVLGEHFHLIGGTSTGAIIAAGLALGLTTDELLDFYMQRSAGIFHSRLRVGGLQSVFDSKQLKAEIHRIVGDITLDSPKLKTGLAIFAKRLDTGSPWIITNNPNGKYWNTAATPGGHLGNRYYSLADVIQASAAAPFYFSPESIEVAASTLGLFVDGGVSPYANPSFGMFNLAAVPAYGYNWETGADRLSIVSIGTGSFRVRAEVHSLPRTAAGLAYRALRSLMADVETNTLMTMQLFAENLTPWVINGEIGDLGGVTASPAPLFRFARYDIGLETAWLENFGHLLPEADIERLRRFDDPQIIPEIYAIAKDAAEGQVRAEHVAALFDNARQPSTPPKPGGPAEVAC